MCRALAQGWEAQIHILCLLELFSLLDTSVSHIPNAPSADPFPGVLSPFLAVETRKHFGWDKAFSNVSARSIIPPSDKLMEGPLYVSSSITMFSTSLFRAASAYTFDGELLFSEIALCPFIPSAQPKSSWNRCHSPAVHDKINLRQSSATSSPCTSHPQSHLSPKQLQIFLPSLPEEPSGGGSAVSGETWI